VFIGVHRRPIFLGARATLFTYRVGRLRGSLPRLVRSQIPRGAQIGLLEGRAVGASNRSKCWGREHPNGWPARIRLDIAEFLAIESGSTSAIQEVAPRSCKLAIIEIRRAVTVLGAVGLHRSVDDARYRAGQHVGRGQVGSDRQRDSDPGKHEYPPGDYGCGQSVSRSGPVGILLIVIPNAWRRIGLSDRSHEHRCHSRTIPSSCRTESQKVNPDLCLGGIAFPLQRAPYHRQSQKPSQQADLAESA
jgi:hypothetical protein